MTATTASPCSLRTPTSATDGRLMLASSSPRAMRWRSRAAPLPLAAGQLVTYTTGTVPERRLPEGTLVILDEAHRGTQNQQSATYKRLLRACTDRAVLLVTATPYQLSTSGLTSMLTINGSPEREQELEPVRTLAARLRPFLVEEAAGATLEVRPARPRIGSTGQPPDHRPPPGRARDERHRQPLPPSRRQHRDRPARRRLGYGATGPPEPSLRSPTAASRTRSTAGWTPPPRPSYAADSLSGCRNG
jgi:hypothetical protein